VNTIGFQQVCTGLKQNGWLAENLFIAPMING